MTDLRLHRPLVAQLLACALVAAGCGKSDTPTGPVATPLTQEAADEIAQQTVFALDQVGLDIDGSATLFLPTSSSRPALGPAVPAGDTSLVLGALNMDVSWDFYDAQDQVLPAYGPTAVRLDWRSHVWGGIETPRDTATVQHHADLSFAGIQPAVESVTVDGTATDTLLNRFRSLDGSVTRYGSWKSALTIASVVCPKAPSSWPTSGTLTYVVRVERLRSGDAGDVERGWNATVVVTFDGTSHPVVVVNGAWTYTWDMETGALSRV